jgi:hypothetical protein
MGNGDMEMKYKVFWDNASNAIINHPCKLMVGIPPIKNVNLEMVDLIALQIRDR